MRSVDIVSSPLATELHTEFLVVPNPIRKRRRRYSVRKHQWTTPGCYRLGDGTLVMHPELIAFLRIAAEA